MANALRCLAYLIGLLVASQAVAKSEAEWTAEWCALHGMSYHKPGDGIPSELKFETPTGRTVYADCIGANAVVEVDFARKFYEGLGQALFYGRLSNLDPILLLIVESKSDCKYFRDAAWLIWQSNQRVQLVSTGVSCRR